jgi:hypothetical protein
MDNGSTRCVARVYIVERVVTLERELLSRVKKEVGVRKWVISAEESKLPAVKDDCVRGQLPLPYTRRKSKFTRDFLPESTILP